MSRFKRKKSPFPVTITYRAGFAVSYRDITSWPPRSVPEGKTKGMMTNNMGSVRYTEYPTNTMCGFSSTIGVRGVAPIQMLEPRYAERI